MTDWEALAEPSANLRSVASIRRACAWLYEEESPLVNTAYGSLQDEVDSLLAAGARYAIWNTAVDGLVEVNLYGTRTVVPVSVLRGMLELLWLRGGSLSLEPVSGVHKTLMEVCSPRSLLVDVGSGAGLDAFAVARAASCRTFAFDREAVHVNGLRELARLNGLQNLSAGWVEASGTGGARPPAMSEWEEPVVRPEGRNSVPITTVDTLVEGIPEAPFDRLVVRVNGYHLAATLAGTAGTLSQHSPVLILPNVEGQFDSVVGILDEADYLIEDRGDHYLAIRRARGNMRG